MVTKITAPGFVWLDIEDANPDHIREAVKEFRLHPLLTADLLRFNRVSKIERYGDTILLVLQIPYVSQPYGDIKAHELDLVVGKTFLITNSSAPIPAVVRFRERLKNPALRERYAKRSVGVLVYAILLRVFNRILPLLDTLESHIEEIEEKLFEGREGELIPRISLSHRNIIDLRRALNPARPVIDAFILETGQWFDPKTELSLRKLGALSRRTTHLLDAHFETMGALERTTQAIFSTKLDGSIRMLTIFTATAIPFTVISSLYGMNLVLPHFGDARDFWLLVGLMATISLGMLGVFRRKRWL